jgi:hypothetical protein
MADGDDDTADFPETWVKLRPLVDHDRGIPASVRMRRALKCLLRSYGIRVEKVQGATPEVRRPLGEP